MNNKKIKVLLITLMAICILSIGTYVVLADNQFTTTATVDNNIINDVNEEFEVIINATNLPSQGLSSGQFYLEYDSNKIQVDTTGDNIDEGKIVYGQNRKNNFSSSVSQDDGSGKITILYYDNSSDLDEPLHDGELFRVKFKYIGEISEQVEKIKVSGEGFSTIRNDKIEDLDSKFNDVSITVRNKKLDIKSITPNEKIYNNKINKLSLNLETTDFDSNTPITIDITRETYYGDLNFDGKITSDDVTLIEEYINKSRAFTSLQVTLADINQDSQIDETDKNEISNYISDSITTHIESRFTAIDKFTIENNKVGDLDIGISKVIINIATLNTIDVGTYKVVAKIDNTSSEEYTFNVEPQPVTGIVIDQKEYNIGVNGSNIATATVSPDNAYIKDIKWSIKDEQYAQVDETGIITGCKIGKTELYANSMDGTSIQGHANLNIVDKSINIENSLEYIPNKNYDEINNKIFDRDGGTIKANVNFVNVSSDSLSYSLIKENDNENLISKVQTNLKDSNKLEIVIPGGTLEYGKYLFKIISEDNINSNTINITIDEYKDATDFQLQYNEQEISEINILKGDSVDIYSKFTPQDATDKFIDFEKSCNDYVDSSSIESGGIKLTAKNVGSCTINVFSRDKKIQKNLRINVIDPVGQIVKTTVTTITGNDFIDKKYGGTIENEIDFNDENIIELKEIKIYNSLNSEVSVENITNKKENNLYKVSITIAENNLDQGTYTVKYKYVVNDIKKTEKEGSYEININEFIPISSININKDKIVLIKNKKYTLKEYSIEPATATYKLLDFESNNNNISVSSTGEITPNTVGNSVLTLKAKDGSNITKQINIEIIDYDISSSDYSVDLENHKINKVTDKLKYSDFISKFSINDQIVPKIFRNDVENDTDFIGTGDILKTYINDDLINSYTLIVDGDLNQDGKILANDILIIKRHILKSQILDGIYYEAANIDKNSSVNAIDILYLKRYILNKTSNVWGE